MRIKDEKVSCTKRLSNVSTLCSVYLRLMLVKGLLLMMILSKKIVICALVGAEWFATQQRTDNGLSCLFSIRLG